MLIILYLRTMKNILEEIDYGYDKGGKEGLFNWYFKRSRLKDTLEAFEEREKGISPLTLSEEEYQSNLKACRLSREELLNLLETGDY